MMCSPNLGIYSKLLNKCIIQVCVAIATDVRIRAKVEAVLTMQYCETASWVILSGSECAFLKRRIKHHNSVFMQSVHNTQPSWKNQKETNNRLNLKLQLTQICVF